MACKVILTVCIQVSNIHIRACIIVAWLLTIFNHTPSSEMGIMDKQRRPKLYNIHMQVYTAAIYIRILLQRVKASKLHQFSRYHSEATKKIKQRCNWKELYETGQVTHWFPSFLAFQNVKWKIFHLVQFLFCDDQF